MRASGPWRSQWRTGRATIRHALGTLGFGPPARNGSWDHHQGLIVIFLSSRLVWSEQAQGLPPTSQAGIKV